MLQYALRRLLAAIPLLFGLSVLVFFYVRLIPGDPVVAMLGVDADPHLVAQLREQLGLDRPWWTQYLQWVGGVLHGDFGTSFRSGISISTILSGRIPASLELAMGGLIVALALAIPAGILAGMRRGTPIDTFISGASLIGLAVPSFWLGAMAVMIFSVRLHILPSGGYVPFNVNPALNLRMLVLPAVTLGLAIAPYLARLMRMIVGENMREPFVAFARSQGLRGPTVGSRVVFRNAAPSLAVAIGATVGGLLAGSVIIETLFDWPGTGLLIVSAVTERDYSMIQALLLFYGAVFIVVNLFAELAQGFLDPRIRL